MNKKLAILNSQTQTVDVVCLAATAGSAEEALEKYCEEHDVNESALQWMAFDGQINIL